MTEPKTPWGVGFRCWSVEDINELPTHSIISWRDKYDPDDEYIALLLRADGPDSPVTLQHTTGSYWIDEPERLVDWPAIIVRLGGWESSSD